MRKLLTLIRGLFVSLVFAGQVFAAIPNLSARIEQPKSPTNINELDITVVTLDRQGRAITVKCFKKGPSDGGYAQFGSDIAVTAGGNSVNCETNGGIVNSEGTYLFYAEAYADSETATTTTVSVDYKTSGPGTPTNYSKEKPTDCTYKIKFRTADDSGKTVKVRIYRSENTSFSLDAGTLITTVIIGSNTDGEYTDTIAPCNKTYYYAIRAFDSAENGSGVVGDSEVHTTTTTTTTTTASGAPQGAVAAGTAGNVLGEEEEATGTGEVMGEGSPSAEKTYPPPQPSRTVWPWAVAGGALGLLIVAWLRRRKQQTG